LLVVAGCYFSKGNIVLRKILDKYDANIVLFMLKTTNNFYLIMHVMIITQSIAIHKKINS
jgi:hypothetical protein